ncbi:MAG: hypothetical protein Edafosvirus45_5 [Edafosvirus sp.]|uniref:Uncharacterized protein n=1 Tax=Edafosvirus sp. TaxID=2487765 RepID=A0A3G4ZVI8_9VIRU|nr:MAG: hypothetical protein Edafosvirus45_5 [Edafosvirus sp.]
MSKMNNPNNNDYVYDDNDGLQNEPNVMGKNHTLESISNKIHSDKKDKKERKDNKDDDVDTINLPTSQTDMMVGLLADETKMISEDKRWMYDKSEEEKINPEDKHLKDENLDDYVDHKPQENKMEEPQTRNIAFINPNITNETIAPSLNVGPGASAPTQVAPKILDDEDAKLSGEELMLRKLDMLRKLNELIQYGVKLSQNYTMNSDYKTMKYEYELHKSIRSKQNSVNWMSTMTLSMIHGLEMLNEKYNPFDIKLKGWSEQMNADISNYYDVFSELYEKYSQPGKGMAPEIKFLLMVSGSALRFHLSNSVSLMGSLPSMSDKLDNNPQLVEQLRQRALIDKMKNQTIKNNESLNQRAGQEHSAAVKKASDLQMLQEKKMEHLIKEKQAIQQKMQAQARYEELMKKLQNDNNQRAGPPATQPNQPQQPKIKSPTLPPHLKNQPNNNSVNPPSSKLSNMQFEQMRNQQILKHQELMKKQQEINNKLYRPTKSSDKNEETEDSENNNTDNQSEHSSRMINPNLNNIINKTKREIESRNSSPQKSSNSKKKSFDSHITTVDIVDPEEVSKASISFGGTRGSKKKKTTIKI